MDGAEEALEGLWQILSHLHGLCIRGACGSVSVLLLASFRYFEAETLFRSADGEEGV